MRASLPAEPTVSDEQLEHVVVRQGAADPPLATRHLGRRPERVEDGLLGRVDDGLEDVVQVVRIDA